MPIETPARTAMEEPEDNNNGNRDILMTAEEVRMRLKFKNVQTVQRLAQSGELQGHKIRGKWRFWWSDVRTYIDKL
jgi:excisionase family DNA binding protein